LISKQWIYPIIKRKDKKMNKKLKMQDNKQYMIKLKKKEKQKNKLRKIKLRKKD